MWYLAIFMTPHLKQQEKKNKKKTKKTMVFGGWAGGGGVGVTNIFVIYLRGREFVFPKGLRGRQIACPPHDNVTPPPPPPPTHT